MVLTTARATPTAPQTRQVMRPLTCITARAHQLTGGTTISYYYAAPGSKAHSVNSNLWDMVHAASSSTLWLTCTGKVPSSRRPAVWKGSLKSAMLQYLELSLTTGYPMPTADGNPIALPEQCRPQENGRQDSLYPIWPMPSRSVPWDQAPKRTPPRFALVAGIRAPGRYFSACELYVVVADIMGKALPPARSRAGKKSGDCWHPQLFEIRSKYPVALPIAAGRSMEMEFPPDLLAGIDEFATGLRCDPTADVAKAKTMHRMSWPTPSPYSLRNFGK